MGAVVSSGSPGGSAQHGPQGQAWNGKSAQADPESSEVGAEPTALVPQRSSKGRSLEDSPWDTGSPQAESWCGETQDLSATKPQTPHLKHLPHPVS